MADATYTLNGNRPVYRFCDGVKSGALTLGFISCNYSSSDPGNEPSSDAGNTSSDKLNGSLTDFNTNSKTIKATANTGDESGIGNWISLAILSGGAFIAALWSLRRKEETR